MYEIDFDELDKNKHDKLIIDLRLKEDFEHDNYPGSINIPWRDFDTHLDNMPKD